MSACPLAALPNARLPFAIHLIAQWGARNARPRRKDAWITPFAAPGVLMRAPMFSRSILGRSAGLFPAEVFFAALLRDIYMQCVYGKFTFVQSLDDQAKVSGTDWWYRL